MPDVVGLLEKRDMRQLKKNDCHTVHKSVDKVESLPVCEPNVDLCVTTDGLYDVKVASLIECAPCGIVFEDMSALEKHLGHFHKETTRRFDLPILEKHVVMDDDEPQSDEAHVHENGDQGPSSSQQISEAQESGPIMNEWFKTNCTWCNKEFLCEPVDDETMADASGFMCQRCKNKACGALDRGLSRSYRH